jgi:uncharacterized protein
VIIDCHTHWGICWKQKYGSDATEWLKTLDRYGIDKAVLMGHEGLVHQDKSEADNEIIFEMAQKFPDRIIPVASTWPQKGEAGLKEIERCVKQFGMKALKFHPWMQSFSTADPVFHEMCALAGELDVPIIFHDGTPCNSLPEQIAGLARTFPQTTFVLGHSGILWSWRSALKAAELPNIWLCLCGPHMKAIEILSKKNNFERVIWGSDFGFGFSDPIDYRLNLLKEIFPETALKKILDENPKKLLK